jgi:hypothetical protein
MTRIKVTKLHNIIIIKKEDNDFFIVTKDSFIIPSFNFSALLKFMLFRGLLHPKTLEGLLDEYYNRNN